MRPICDTAAVLRAAEGRACPVDAASALIQAAREASCGVGLICRDGMAQLDAILSDILRGRGADEDLDLVREICEAALVYKECPLSVETAEYLLHSLSDHGEVWQKHIGPKLCDELVCFYSVHVDPEKCVGCGKCAKACPKGCIAGGDGLIHVIAQSGCDGCMACAAACDGGAVVKAGLIKPRTPPEPVPAGSFSAGGGMRKRRKK